VVRGPSQDDVSWRVRVNGSVEACQVLFTSFITEQCRQQSGVTEGGREEGVHAESDVEGAMKEKVLHTDPH
jgi:hypothetical protein